MLGMGREGVGGGSSKDTTNIAWCLALIITYMYGVLFKNPQFSSKNCPIHHRIYGMVKNENIPGLAYLVWLQSANLEPARFW